MEESNRRHFFNHGSDGPAGLDAEKRACHWCQLQRMPLQRYLPVTIIGNDEGTAELPAEFEFIEGLQLREGVERAEDSFRSGCDCGGDGGACRFDTCPCLAEVDHDGDDDGGDEEEEQEPEDGGLRDGFESWLDNPDGGDEPSSEEELRKMAEREESHAADGRKETFAYCSHGERKGMLKSRTLRSSRPIYECHSGCSCSARCPNRVVERGRTVPLQIFHTGARGWGVRSTVPVRRGQFVDCYVGEVLTPEQANARRDEAEAAGRKDVYLFALDKFHDADSHDERLRVPLEVDGTFRSGPTRFVNHSCDPNMRIFARVGDHADKHLHELALFAVRDIARGEELTFDYVDGVLRPDPGDKEMMPCLCGSANCRGYLF